MVYLSKSGSKLLMLNTSMYGSYAVWYVIVESTYKKFPRTERVPDVAPYEIKPARAFKIRQKVAKTVTMTVFA